MVFSFIKKVGKGTVKTVANLPGWLGYTSLKENTIGVFRMVRPMYQKVDLTNKEKMTFEQVVAKYNLSDTDLALRLRNLYWQSWMFGVLALLSFFYAFYLFWSIHLLAGVLALCIMMYLIVKVITARFWIFQIKKRKLGCSFEEWLNSINEE